MRALVFDGSEDLEVRDVPDPAIHEPTDAIIEVRAACSSGTDAHVFDDPLVEEGRILGADFAGVIAETGTEVDRFEQGDRVVPGVMTHCGDCFFCDDGLYAHCEAGGWRLGYEIDGGRAELARIPLADRNLYRIPEAVSFRDAMLAMAGLPTGFEMATAAEIDPGDSVAVIGAGAIGLMALECTGLWGPAETAVVDLVDARLGVAETMGADLTVNAQQSDPDQILGNMNGGYGPDAVIEAGGIEATYELALEAIRIGGTAVLMGYHDETYDLPFGDVWAKNLTVRFGFVNATAVPTLLSLIDVGRIDLEPLFTREVGLSDIEGIDDIVGPDMLKTVIDPQA